MPRNKTILTAIILTLTVIQFLLLAGCGSTSTPATAETTIADQTQTRSLESTGESSTPTRATIEAQAAATSRPVTTPTRAQVAELLDLVLFEQGFSQDGSQLAYGFEIENPNLSAVSNNAFQIMAYDENGLLLGSEVENIPMLLAGQLLGVAGSLQLEDEGLVDEIFLQFTTGNMLEIEVQPELSVIGVNYRPSEIYERVSGLIGNEGDLDLEDIRISAIAYDGAGQIVGAGYTFLSFLPAGSSAGVDIVLTTNEPVDRVELYPRVSLPTLLQTRSNRPPLTAELALLDNGFSQSGIEVGYGFLVTNPNTSYALENTEYRVTFFNERDDVIAVDEGYLDLLLPQETFGIGDHVFVDEGETVGRMVVLARPSLYRPAIHKPTLAAENVTVISDTLSTMVTGEIVNPYETALDNVRVSAVVYNDEGLIVGGGFEWIDTIPPAGLVPVEVWVSAAKSAISAELFAGVTEIIRE